VVASVVENLSRRETEAIADCKSLTETLRLNYVTA